MIKKYGSVAKIIFATTCGSEIDINTAIYCVIKNICDRTKLPPSLPQHLKLADKSGPDSIAISCTQYPAIYDSLSISLCDCPGFEVEDTRGYEERLMTLINVRLLAKLAIRIRGVVVVIEKSSFDSNRADSFKRLTRILTVLFASSKMDEIKKSLLLVVTKDPTLKKEGIKVLVNNVIAGKIDELQRLMPPGTLIVKYLQDILQNIKKAILEYIYVKESQSKEIVRDRPQILKEIQYLMSDPTLPPARRVRIKEIQQDLETLLLLSEVTTEKDTTHVVIADPTKNEPRSEIKETLDNLPGLEEGQFVFNDDDQEMRRFLLVLSKLIPQVSIAIKTCDVEYKKIS